MDATDVVLAEMPNLLESLTAENVATWAAALALASTPIAFAVLSRQPWFQARRGRTAQRPSFPAVVVGMLLVMGVPAILLGFLIKSRRYDEDRYEFDPNRTLSVLDQGRQYEAQSRMVAIEKADRAVKAEMERLATQRKDLLNAVKDLDDRLLALGEAASQSQATAQPMIRVAESMGTVRRAVGHDSSTRWDELVVRLESAPPTVMVASAGPGAPAAAPAPAEPVRGLARPVFEAELATVPAPQRDLAGLLPLASVPEGWAVGELGDGHLETFNAENLYEKIDGRAESFTQYDVTGMAYANFHPQAEDSGEVQLYIFSFADALKAFGKYASEKPEGATPVAIGDEGYASAGSVSFLRDKFFVQVVSTSDAPEFAAFSEAIARKVSAKIGGEPDPSEGAPAPPAVASAAPEAKPGPAAAPEKKGATPAQMFALLPDGPGRDHPQYVAQDAFGYSFLANVFLADYKDDDTTWQGFLRPYADADAAREKFEQYLDTAKADGAEIKEVEAEGADRMVVSSNIGLVDVVFLKGNAFAGANGATAAGPAEAFAREFAEGLPAAVPTIAEPEAPAAAGGEY
jgi:hypothetical protein